MDNRRAVANTCSYAHGGEVVWSRQAATEAVACGQGNRVGAHDLASPGGPPPTTRQEGGDAAVGFEFDPPSTYSRAIYPQDARSIGQRQANVRRCIRKCAGNDIGLSARFCPSRVISVGVFHSAVTRPIFSA